MEITRAPRASTEVEGEIITTPSAIEAEVNLARGSWVLAEHLRPGDLVASGVDSPPFIVGNWMGCAEGFLVYGESGEECLCPRGNPVVFMVEADFMRKNFPGAM